MTTTENETTHRLSVRYQPVDGLPPWRAVIVTPKPDAPPLGAEVTPVGRFADQTEAIRTGCTALRFIAAGIPWRVRS